MTELPPPGQILAYRIADAGASPEGLKWQPKIGSRGGEAIGRGTRDRFLPLLESLSADPLAEDWAARGPAGRLAAFILPDQCSCNILRKSPRAFAQDRLALHLCREGVEAREDQGQSETGRVFLYLPLEHSENLDDQNRAIEHVTALHASTRPGFSDFTKPTLD